MAEPPGDASGPAGYTAPSPARILRNIAIVLVLLAVPAAAWMLAGDRNSTPLTRLDGPVQPSADARTLYMTDEPTDPVSCRATASDGADVPLAPARGFVEVRVGIGATERYWAVSRLPLDRGALTVACTAGSAPIDPLFLGPASN